MKHYICILNALSFTFALFPNPLPYFFPRSTFLDIWSLRWLGSFAETSVTLYHYFLLLLLLLWSHNSDRVSAFLTMSVHLRQSCTFSAHFTSFIFFRSFLTSSSHPDLALQLVFLSMVSICVLFLLKLYQYNRDCLISEWSTIFLDRKCSGIAYPATVTVPRLVTGVSIDGRMKLKAYAHSKLRLLLASPYMKSFCNA